MIKKILVSVIVAGLAFMSCKKDKEITPSNTEVLPIDSTNTVTPNDSIDSGSNNNTVDPKSVQGRLNQGISPVIIYNSDNTLLDSLYGKTYQGGLIFYLNMADSSGMVASSVDNASSDWGCNTTFLAEFICDNGFCIPLDVYASGQSVGDGLKNSQEMADQCPGSVAHQSLDLVVGEYTDWYLPSLQEAKFMYNKLGLTGGYWTSSQDSEEYAWSVTSSTDGAIHLTSKKNLNRKVRSVRSF